MKTRAEVLNSLSSLSSALLRVWKFQSLALNLIKMFFNDSLVIVLSIKQDRPAKHIRMQPAGKQLSPRTFCPCCLSPRQILRNIYRMLGNTLPTKPMVCHKMYKYEQASTQCSRTFPISVIVRCLRPITNHNDK